MTDREKLIELLQNDPCPGLDIADCGFCQYVDAEDCFAERIADHLLANGVTIQRWIPASEPPKEYINKYRELTPFLVCVKGTEYPFRALYDGKRWGDGLDEIFVTHWMPLPEAPKEGK